MNEDDKDYFPAPEEFQMEPEKEPGPLAHFPSFRHALPAVVTFMLFYIATAVYAGYPAGEYLWLSGSALFGRHEYWRLVTALFTHADLTHLLANALIFIGFGWMLKAYFGWIVFPAASIIIGLVTNLVTITAYDPQIKLLGASGMAYGMVALWLVLYIRYDTDRRVPVRVFRAAGFALIMMFPTTFDPHVSYLAHAAGFGLGIIAGMILITFVSVRSPG